MCRSERAFTLVEVLVSLTLVLGVMAGVLGWMDHLSANSIASLRRSQAHHLLMGIMVRLPGGQGSPQLWGPAIAEASRLVSAVMPGASLHHAPLCPRLPGSGCLVIGWGPDGPAPCVHGGGQSTEVSCLAIAL